MNDAPPPSPPAADSESRPVRNKLNVWRWFWIATLVVSLGYAWHCFYVPANHIAWADDHASALRQAARSGKPVILFFTGKWCVPCRIMKRNVWADDQVQAAVDGRYIPVTIDVDDPDAAETLSRYRVGATPTTIMTDSQGTLLQRADGEIGKSEFLAWLGNSNASAAPGDGAGR